MTHRRPDPSDLFAEEPRLRALIGLARERLAAEEVWLFGSRARGDQNARSDWDLLVVVPDDARPDVDDPVEAWRLGRDCDLPADVLIARRRDFVEAEQSLNTLAAIARREGVRLDV